MPISLATATRAGIYPAPLQPGAISGQPVTTPATAPAAAPPVAATRAPIPLARARSIAPAPASPVPAGGEPRSLGSEFSGALAQSLTAQNARGLAGTLRFAGLDEWADRVDAFVGQGAGQPATVGAMEDIRFREGIGTALNDAGSYIAGQLGNALGSMAPVIAAGGAGGLAGSAVPGIGNVAGAAVGAASASTVLNLGDIYQTLLDEGVEPGLARRYTMAAAPPIVALDIWGLGRITGVSVVAREAAKRGILRAVREGMTVEAATEAVQEAIQSATEQHAVTGEIDPAAVAMRAANAAVGGALGGGVVGGAAQLVTPRPPPAEEEAPLAAAQPGLPAPPAQLALPPPSAANRAPGTGQGPFTPEPAPIITPPPAAAAAAAPAVPPGIGGQAGMATGPVPPAAPVTGVPPVPSPARLPAVAEAGPAAVPRETPTTAPVVPPAAAPGVPGVAAPPLGAVAAPSVPAAVPAPPSAPQEPFEYEAVTAPDPAAAARQIAAVLAQEFPAHPVTVKRSIVQVPRTVPPEMVARAGQLTMAAQRGEQLAAKPAAPAAPAAPAVPAAPSKPAAPSAPAAPAAPAIHSVSLPLSPLMRTAAVEAIRKHPLARLARLTETSGGVFIEVTGGKTPEKTVEGLKTALINKRDKLEAEYKAKQQAASTAAAAKKAQAQQAAAQKAKGKARRFTEAEELPAKEQEIKAEPGETAYEPGSVSDELHAAQIRLERLEYDTFEPTLEGHRRHQRKLEKARAKVARLGGKRLLPGLVDRPVANRRLRQMFDKYSRSQKVVALEVFRRFAFYKNRRPSLARLDDARDDPAYGTFSHVSAQDSFANFVALNLDVEEDFKPRVSTFIHEMAHWAYENILTDADRALFWKHIESFYDRHGNLDIDKLERAYPSERSGNKMRPNELFAYSFEAWFWENRVPKEVSASAWNEMMAKVGNLLRLIVKRFLTYKTWREVDITDLFEKVAPEKAAQRAEGPLGDLMLRLENALNQQPSSIAKLLPQLDAAGNSRLKAMVAEVREDLAAKEDLDDVYWLDFGNAALEQLLRVSEGRGEGTRTEAELAGLPEAPLPIRRAGDEVADRPEDLSAIDLLYEGPPQAPPKSRSVDQVGRLLEVRARRILRALGFKSGQIEGPSKKGNDILSTAIAAEIERALKESGNAQNWYSKLLDEAIATASLIHPEIATDPNARGAFLFALAITSQNVTVEVNVGGAEKVYAAFKETYRPGSNTPPRFPTDYGVGKAGKAMKKAFTTANRLIERHGLSDFTRFMQTPVRAGDLTKAGFDPGEKPDTMVHGSSIFGAKIGGGFFQNLSGNYDPVTIDMWFMRGWGRLMGWVIGRYPDSPEGVRSRFRDALAAAGQTVPEDNTKLKARAKAVKRRFEAQVRAGTASYDPDKKPTVVKTAERVLSLTAPRDTPDGVNERAWIREVFQQAQSKLKDRGLDLTIADMQAIWWYPEKKLWERMGGPLAERLSTDFAREFNKLAKAKGFTDAQISEAVQAGRARGRDLPAGEGAAAGRRHGVHPLSGGAVEGILVPERERAAQLRKEKALSKGLDPRKARTARKAIGFESEDRPTNPRSRELAEQYKRIAGINKPAYTEKRDPPVEYLKRVADLLESMPLNSLSDPAVRRAYEAMARETVAQFHSLGGLEVIPWRGKGEPYASSAEMIDDVLQNQRLKFYLTDSGFGTGADAYAGHPLLEPSGLTAADGTPLLVNDVFRVVHDLFGHTQSGFNFGPVGEYNAFHEHARMYSDAAVPAVAAETLAQNAWVNFGPHMRRPDGSIPQQGDPDYIPIPQRRFADQKVFVVPPEMLAEDPGGRPPRQGGIGVEDRPVKRARGSPLVERAMAMALAPEDTRPLHQKLVDWVKHITERVRAGWEWALFDDLSPIKRLARGFMESTALTREIVPYVAAVASRHTGGQMQILLQHSQLEVKTDASGLKYLAQKEGTKGLYQILDPLVKGKQDRRRLFEIYAYARRVVTQRLVEQDREQNLTREQAEAVLAEARRDNPDFERIFDELQEWKTSILDVAEAMGLVNAEQRSVWEQADHVPFYRLSLDEVVRGPGTARGLVGQTAGIMRLTGKDKTWAVFSPEGQLVARYAEKDEQLARAEAARVGGTVQLGGLPIPGIVENLARNAMHLLDASMRNYAAVETKRVAVRAKVMERVPMTMKQALVPEGEIERFLEEHGIDPLHAPQGFDALNSLWAIAVPKEKDIVAIREGGKTEFYRVSDPLLYNALTQLHRAVAGDFFASGPLKGLVTLKSFFTRMVTQLDPGFIARNAVRDSISAWVQGIDHMTPLVASLKGAKAAWKQNASVRALMAAGGDTGWYAKDPKEVLAELQSHRGGVRGLGRQAVEFWKSMARASEMMNRVATYDAAIRAGASPGQAAFEAADLLDFQRRGGWQFLQILVAITPFLNARIQGLYRLGRAGLGAPKQRRAFYLKGGMLAGMALALALLNAGDDEYKEQDEELKDANYLIPLHRLFPDDVLQATGLPRFAKIPKAFEVGIIFGTAIERMVQLMMGNDRGLDTYKAAKHAFWGTLAMNPAENPLISEAIEQWSNKDMYWNRPIVGRGLEGLPPHLQYTPGRTADILVDIAYVMPEIVPDWFRSPQRLEHAIRGFTGTVGMYALAVLDEGWRTLTGAPSQATRDVWELPILRSFGTPQTPRTTRWGDRYYEMLDEVRDAWNARRRYMDEGATDRLQALIAAKGHLFGVRAEMERTARQLTQLRKAWEAVYRSDLSPEEKQRRQDAITERRNMLFRRVEEWERRAEAFRERRSGRVEEELVD